MYSAVNFCFAVACWPCLQCHYTPLHWALFSASPPLDQPPLLCILSIGPTTSTLHPSIGPATPLLHPSIGPATPPLHSLYWTSHSFSAPSLLDQPPLHCTPSIGPATPTLHPLYWTSHPYSAPSLLDQPPHPAPSLLHQPPHPYTSTLVTLWSPLWHWPLSIMQKWLTFPEQRILVVL